MSSRQPLAGALEPSRPRPIRAKLSAELGRPVPRPSARPRVVVGLTAVIVAVTDEVPRLLTVSGGTGTKAMPASVSDHGRGRPETLPFGPLDSAADRTLELGLRKLVRAQSGLELGYVEQLYTFGDMARSGHGHGNVRDISVAYLALVREERVARSGASRWRDVYEFLPWEDWREGRPRVLDQTISPALRRWADAPGVRDVRRARRERADITFGLGGAPFDRLRVLERYELLYEVGLVAEAAESAAGGRAGSGAPSPVHLGRAMGMDHRRILASALSRLRGKLQYRPVVFELLPHAFTLFQLQRLVEALAGVRLHKQNFRRLVEHGGLVEGTGRLDARTGGRPAGLFRFRREVLRERRAPGVGLPATRES